MDSGYSLPFGPERNYFSGQMVSDIACGYQMLRWLQPEAEINYTHGYFNQGADSASLALTAGLVMNVAPNWRIDAGGRQTIYGRTADADTGVILNVSHTFNKQGKALTFSLGPGAENCGRRCLRDERGHWGGF